MNRKKRNLEVTVINGQKVHRIKISVYRDFIAKLVQETKTEADQVSILFTDDDTMRSFNRQYRKKDRTTDVISFPWGGKNLEGVINIGDIVISVQRAFDQAGDAGWSLEREIKKLLVHGFLHLIGYDHKTDRSEMAMIEEKVFKKLTAH